MIDTTQDRRTARGALLVSALAMVALVTTGCGDDFHSVSEGDCVSGNIHVDSNLRIIDCTEYDRSEDDHYRVQAVFEDTADARCGMGAIGIEDGDRVVCFGR